MIAEPQWIALPAAFVGDETKDKATSARVQAIEESENRATAEQAKTRILSFLDGLLSATEAPKFPVSALRDPVRQQVLRAILDIQGNSGRYTHETTIAERLGLKVEEVEGYLELLRGEGKIEFTRSSSGCAGYLTDAQKQRFKESQMTEPRLDIRRRILETLLEIQGNSNIYTNDQELAGKLGLTVEEVDGHLEILRDERKLKFTRSSAGCSVTLTEGQKQRFKESQMATRRTVGGSLPRNIPVEITESIELFRKDHPDPRKVAFVMMRFATTSAHNNIVESIRSTLQPLGLVGVRADEKQYHPDLWYNILTYLAGCGFGIAVFERIEQEEFNPNVALEVGYLYGVRKPVCLLKDTTLKILHADIMGKLWCPFNAQDPKGTIPPPLKKWMSDNGIIAAP